MAASKREIQEWFERGKSEGATHMIVICDTFDYEDFPVFVKPEEDVREKERAYSGKNMQRVMEVYNLGADVGEQLSQHRVFNY